MFRVYFYVPWLVSNVSKYLFSTIKNLIQRSPVVVDKIMLGAWPKMPTSTSANHEGGFRASKSFP